MERWIGREDLELQSKRITRNNNEIIKVALPELESELEVRLQNLGL